MIRRAAYTVSTVLLALVAFTPAASAASSQQIQRDAATDCVLDGDYTLQELRSADRSVGVDQREYGCWDEPYAAYLRTLAAGDTGPVVPPRIPPKDSNKNGRIDPAERATAENVNKAVIAKYRKKYGKRVKVSTPVVAVKKDDTDDPGADDPESSDGASTKSDDGTPWWLALLVVPLAILAFGAFRLQRVNRAAKIRGAKRETPATAGGDEPPPSSFTSGPDER